MKSSLDKLRVLLPHWIEHNKSHIAEFSKWEGEVRNEQKEIARMLEKAIRDMEQAGDTLAEALDRIGGPLQGNDHHHHH